MSREAVNCAEDLVQLELALFQRCILSLFAWHPHYMVLVVLAIVETGIFVVEREDKVGLSDILEPCLNHYFLRFLAKLHSNIHRLLQPSGQPPRGLQPSSMSWQRLVATSSSSQLQRPK